MTIFGWVQFWNECDEKFAKQLVTVGLSRKNMTLIDNPSMLFTSSIMQITFPCSNVGKSKILFSLIKI